MDDRSESCFLACICESPELRVTLDVDTAADSLGYPLPVEIELVDESDDVMEVEGKSPKYEPVDEELDIIENIGHGPREGT